MGMTIESEIEYLKNFDSYSPYQEAVNKVIAYIEQFQADYKNRLKADMAAMLDEFDLRLSEYQDADLIRVDYIRQDIQEKIDALRGEDDDK